MQTAWPDKGLRAILLAANCGVKFCGCVCVNMFSDHAARMTVHPRVFQKADNVKCRPLDSSALQLVGCQSIDFLRHPMSLEATF
jgi:hypothetical protein